MYANTTLKDTLFSQNIWSESLQLNLTELTDKITAIAEKDPGRIVSNRGGWQSSSKNRVDYIWMQEIIHNLTSGIINTVYKDLGIDRKPILCNYWFNISAPGAFNWLHAHPGSIVSSVVYIQCPQNSGAIVFENPLSVSSVDSERGILPKSNTVLAFPATLTHRVEPNQSKDNRISIALNWM